MLTLTPQLTAPPAAARPPASEPASAPQPMASSSGSPAVNATVPAEKAGKPASDADSFSAKLNQARSVEAGLAGHESPDASLAHVGRVDGDEAGGAQDAAGDILGGTETSEMLLAMLSDVPTPANPLPDASVPAALALAPTMTTLRLPNPDSGAQASLPPADAAISDADGARALQINDQGKSPPLVRPAVTTGADAPRTTGVIHQAAPPALTSTDSAADPQAPPAPAALTVTTAATSLPANAPLSPRIELQVPATISVTTPVSHPHFHEETAQHVSWLVRNGIEQARINVHPADLGPIEIRIALHNKEAIISFAVAQPETSTALENALPRLREMLAASGISLGQTSVGSDGSNPAASAGHSDADRHSREQQAARLLLEQTLAAGSAAPAGALRTTSGAGLVDLFA